MYLQSTSIGSLNDWYDAKWNKLWLEIGLYTILKKDSSNDLNTNKNNKQQKPTTKTKKLNTTKNREYKDDYKKQEDE